MFYPPVIIITIILASLDIIVGVRLNNKTIINDLFDVNPILICAGVLKLSFALPYVMISLLNNFHLNSDNVNKIKIEMFYHAIKRCFAYIFMVFSITWYLFCMTLCAVVISGKYSNAYYGIIAYIVASSFFSLSQIGLFFC
jgi:hypothetical protein